MSDAPISELEFLRKLQRLLTEGDFVATYKFALLNALADLSLERAFADDGSLRVPVRAIAEKFIEYYWRQARPYRALDGNGFVLFQNTGRQASVVSVLAQRQAAHHTLPAARAAAGWDTLVGQIAATVAQMPLWKLQTVGSESDEFLYRKAELADDAIRLLPGVPAAFRALYGLAVFASVLRGHQAGLCLYCRGNIKGAGDVDHFIAWSRYPADLGFNLVLSHRLCNSKKRDFLAHPAHIESWHRSHVERAAELAQRFEAARLPHDIERTRAVVSWAYEQGEAAGAHVWMRDDRFERLDSRWRDALSGALLPRVAEPPPVPYGST